MIDLDIYLSGVHIGRTSQRGRGKKFAIEYLDSITAQADAESILLSCSLPLPGPSGPSNAQAFLEGLLPEGRALEAMAARVRDVQLTSDDASLAEPSDVLNLLAEYGRECAGAVALVPENEPSPVSGSYRPLSASGVETLIADLPNNPLGADSSADIRMSLAGNQPKLLLARFNDHWFEALDGAPTTHIVKPTSAWPLSADNEAIVMTIARSAGLTPSSTWVDDVAGMRVLVTERYDRVVDSESHTVIRRHQEDMCQALGIRPRDKYHVGRASDRMVRLLRSVPIARGSGVRALFEQVAFRALIGDEDGHAKNYGLLLEDGEVSIAPLYDCLATQAYPDLSGRMGTPVGRQHTLAKVDRRALVEEGVAFGIPEREVDSILHDLVVRTREGIDQLPADRFDARAMDAVTSIVHARIDRLADGAPLGHAPRGTSLQSPTRTSMGTLDSATWGRLPRGPREFVSRKNPEGDAQL